MLITYQVHDLSEWFTQKEIMDNIWHDVRKYSAAKSKVYRDGLLTSIIYWLTGVYEI